MGFALDSCPTLHRCCTSVPLRVGVLVIGLLGLAWAAACLFLCTGPGGDELRRAGLAEGAVQVAKYAFGSLGALQVAAHVLLLVAGARRSARLLAAYGRVQPPLALLLLAAGGAVAAAAALAGRAPFACGFLALAFLSVLLSFYFLIVVANYRMTLS